MTQALYNSVFTQPILLDQILNRLESKDIRSIMFTLRSVATSVEFNDTAVHVIWKRKKKKQDEAEVCRRAIIHFMNDTNTCQVPGCEWLFDRAQHLWEISLCFGDSSTLEQFWHGQMSITRSMFAHYLADLHYQTELYSILIDFTAGNIQTRRSALNILPTRRVIRRSIHNVVRVLFGPVLQELQYNWRIPLNTLDENGNMDCAYFQSTNWP
jgi:hypothetical protein